MSFPLLSTTSSSMSLPILILANLVMVAVVVGVIVLIVRRRRRNQATLDPTFEGAPMAHGVVTDLKYQYRQVNNRRLYRITYRVQLAEGQQFYGWEEKYLARLTEKTRFDVGSHHLIAYRPGWEQVRSVPQGAR
ncbi:hypothetical protein [Ruania zhangjianzhongii]|uniref:hypothetical protein n=1 Tax=Ruania zhangjianzhongii TaxID=2603206 RepID=UPI0011CBB808|nr:hypothetical protein [Ruania zhangjianzhongii]